MQRWVRFPCASGRYIDQNAPHLLFGCSGKPIVANIRPDCRRSGGRVSGVVIMRDRLQSHFTRSLALLDVLQRVRLRGPQSQALPGRRLRRLAATRREKCGLGVCAAEN